MIPYIIAGAIGFVVAKLFEEDEAPKYADGGSVLLAPNGKPSNLTPEQYKLVRTPAFKKWFGDWENSPETASKIVDSNGEPLVCYHGTLFEFNIFEKTIFGKFGKGIYFTSYIDSARKYAKNYENSRVIPVFLKSIKLVKTEKIFIDQIKDLPNDYDCIWSRDEDNEELEYEYQEPDEIVVYTPNQIKLADGSNTTFDGNNPDIRYAGGGSVSLKKLLDFKLDEVQIDNEYAHANLGIEQLSDGEVSIYISEIWSDIKGEGYATKLLNKLKKFSNKSGVPLSLRASVSNNIQTSSGLNQQELVDWYIKNGFEISEKDNNFEKDLTAPFMVYNR